MVMLRKENIPSSQVKKLPSLTYLTIRKFVREISEDPINSKRGSVLDAFSSKINPDSTKLLLELSNYDNLSEYSTIYDAESCFKNPKDYRTIRKFLIEKLHKQKLPIDLLELAFLAVIERLIAVAEINGYVKVFTGNLDARGFLDSKHYVYVNDVLSVSRTVLPFFERYCSDIEKLDEDSHIAVLCFCKLGIKDCHIFDLAMTSTEITVDLIQNAVGSAYATGQYDIAESLRVRLDDEEQEKVLINAFNDLRIADNKLALLEYFWSKCTDEQKKIVANCTLNVNSGELNYNLDYFARMLEILAILYDPVPTVIVDLFSRLDEDVRQSYIKSVIRFDTFGKPTHYLEFLMSMANEENKTALRKLAASHIGIVYYAGFLNKPNLKIKDIELFMGSFSKNMHLALGYERAESFLVDFRIFAWAVVNARYLSFEHLSLFWSSLSRKFIAEYLFDIIWTFLMTPMSDKKIREIMSFFLRKAVSLGVIKHLEKQLYRFDLEKDTHGHVATTLLYFNKKDYLPKQYISENLQYFIDYTKHRPPKVARLVFSGFIGSHEFSELILSLDYKSKFEFLPEITDGVLSGTIMPNIVNNLLKPFLLTEEQPWVVNTAVRVIFQHVIHKAMVVSVNPGSSRTLMAIDKFRVLMNLLGRAYDSREKNPADLLLRFLSELLTGRDHNILLHNSAIGKGKFFKLRHLNREVNPFDNMLAKSTTEDLAIKAYLGLQTYLANLRNAAIPLKNCNHPRLSR